MKQQMEMKEQKELHKENRRLGLKALHAKPQQVIELQILAHAKQKQGIELQKLELQTKASETLF